MHTRTHNCAKSIVRRLSALEEMSGMEVLASDKTGTLTLNQCVMASTRSLTFPCLHA